MQKRISGWMEDYKPKKRVLRPDRQLDKTKHMYFKQWKAGMITKEQYFQKIHDIKKNLNTLYKSKESNE